MCLTPQIIYEKQLLKERQKEDHLFGDKEKFVTAGYKKKLQEDAQWAQEEALRLQREEQDDVRVGLQAMRFSSVIGGRDAACVRATYQVTKKGDMSGLYRNLLKTHSKYGGGAAAPAAARALDPAATDVERAMRPNPQVGRRRVPLKGSEGLSMV